MTCSRGFILNADTDELLRKYQSKYTVKEQRQFQQKREHAKIDWKCHSCLDFHPAKQEYVACDRLDKNSVTTNQVVWSC